MISATQLAALQGQAQAAMEEVSPGTITIGGHALACSVIRPPSHTDLVEGGFGENRSLIVRVRKTLVTGAGLTLSERSTVATYGGLSWRLEAIGGHMLPAWHLTFAAK